MTQPPGKLVIRYRKHSMDTCGARRAPLSARPQPRRQWLAPLKVLSLLFLTAPISAWASDLQPQNIEPRARPFNGSRTSGGSSPTCEVGPEFVTPVYAVEGFNVTFHCPCTPPLTSCRRLWIQSYLHLPGLGSTQNNTHLMLWNMSHTHQGLCVVCQRQEAVDSYLLFNITAVAKFESLHFESSSVQSPKDPDNTVTLRITTPRLTNGSYNFSLECPVQGYPPYHSLSWNLSDWEQLQPCASFSNDNRTVTFRVAKEFNIANRDVIIRCTASNELGTLTGKRKVDPNAHLRNELEEFFAEPLQMQTAGKVELSALHHNASFVCASKGYSNYQVCSVSYSTLTVVERCTDSDLSASTTCCAVNRYGLPSGNCSSFSAHQVTAEQNTVYMINVTTSVPGYYQCQVFNSKVKGYQSVGEPILVAPSSSTAVDGGSTLYLYLFIGSMVVIGVLLLILLGVAVGVVYSRVRGRKSPWSPSDDEGRRLLRRQSTRSSNCSSACDLGHTAVIIRGEGSRHREVGQPPVFSDPPLLPLHEGTALTNGAVPLQTLESLLDFYPSNSMNSSLQSSNTPFDDSLETVFEASNAPQPSGNTGVHQEPSGNTGVHQEPSGNTGVHQEPSGNTGVHQKPSGNTGVHQEPSVPTPCRQADPPLPPVSLQLLVEYIPQMAPKWYVLAVGLGVSTDAAIIEDSNERADKKCTKALGAWVDAGRDVTWPNLLHVLRTQNLGAVATSIERKLNLHSRPVP